MSDNVVVTEQNTTVTVDEGDSSRLIVVAQPAVQVVSVAEQGPEGAQGPKGDQGPQGITGSGDSHFEQAFSGLTSVTVNHNLGKYPSVAVIDSAGDLVVGDVDVVNLNTVIVSFSAMFSGTVLVN